MITNHDDFLAQLKVISEGINIPAYDTSKIMDSTEFNTYFQDIEKSLNNLTLMTRSLEDCNEYMIRYVNTIVDEKTKEIHQKLETLEKNYSLYQDKNFIAHTVEFDTATTVYDRDGSELKQQDYQVQQSAHISLLKNVSTEAAYSLTIDQKNNTAMIVFENNGITDYEQKIATFIVKLTEPIKLNYISCNLVNCTGSFTINNSIATYSFNEYFEPEDVSIIVITIKSLNYTLGTKEVIKKRTKGFMDNAYQGLMFSNTDNEKTKEQQMAQIYYENDVTRYIGEVNGRRSKN